MQEPTPAPWLKHLAADEHIVWSGVTSEELRVRELGERRQSALAIVIVSIVVGLLLAFGLVNTPGVKPGWWIPDLTGMVIGWPLYTLGIIICVSVAGHAAGTLKASIAPEMFYVLTSTRLLACDASGRTVRQLGRHEIASVAWLDGYPSPGVAVRMKGALWGQSPFEIRNVPDLEGLARAMKPEPVGG